MQIQFIKRRSLISIMLIMLLSSNLGLAKRQNKADEGMREREALPFASIAAKVKAVSRGYEEVKNAAVVENEKPKKIENYEFSQMISDMNDLNKRLGENEKRQNVLFVNGMLLIYKEIIRKFINCTVNSLEKLSINPLYYEIVENDRPSNEVREIIQIVEVISSKASLVDVIHHQREFYDIIYKFFRAVAFKKMRNIDRNLSNLKSEDTMVRREEPNLFETEYKRKNINVIRHFFSFKMEQAFKTSFKNYIETKWTKFTDLFTKDNSTNWGLSEEEERINKADYCSREDEYLVSTSTKVIDIKKIDKIIDIKKIKETRDKISKYIFIGVSIFSPILINILGNLLGGLGILLASFSGVAAAVPFFAVLTLYIIFAKLSES